MGSRYLIVEFEDESAAMKLKEQIDRATRAGKRFRVVGLFAKPTDYCQCDPRLHVLENRQKKRTLVRGKKYGWWVCAICRKPTPTMAGIRNLLKPRDIINPIKFFREKDWRGGPGFEATHYINSISVEAAGPGSIDFWNSRD